LSSHAKRSNPALDLLGDVPVTWDEVYDWVEIVAETPRDAWRASYYIKNWNVVDKIREAKKPVSSTTYWPRTGSRTR
jgi:hypothetical protein